MLLNCRCAIFSEKSKILGGCFRLQTYADLSVRECADGCSLRSGQVLRSPKAAAGGLLGSTAGATAVLDRLECIKVVGCLTVLTAATHRPRLGPSRRSYSCLRSMSSAASAPRVLFSDIDGESVFRPPAGGASLLIWSRIMCTDDAGRSISGTLVHYLKHLAHVGALHESSSGSHTFTYTVRTHLSTPLHMKATVHTEGPLPGTSV